LTRAHALRLQPVALPTLLRALVRGHLFGWVARGALFLLLGRGRLVSRRRLAQLLLGLQRRLPSSGIGGISLIESRGRRDTEAVDAQKIAGLLAYFAALSPSAQTRAAQLFALDLLRGVEKRRFERRLPESERWRAALKWVFLTIGDACNLGCAGCYVRDRRPGLPQLDDLDFAVSQAKRLGVFFVHVVGRGEPFLDDDHRRLLFGLAERHPDQRFTVLTNGTLIDNADAVRLARCGNVIPFVSIDGLAAVNDSRRGTGVFAAVERACELLSRQAVLHCFSATVHRGNYEHVTSAAFIDKMVELGNRLGIFCQYDPVGAAVDRALLLRPYEKERYRALLSAAQERTSIPLRDQTFLEEARGCQARLGRSLYLDGLTGAVTPCFKTPYAPRASNLYSDRHPDRLLEILGSDFFRRYRGDHVSGWQCFTERERELEWFSRAPEIEAPLRQTIPLPPPPASDRPTTYEPGRLGSFGAGSL
jgi:MoaA/NifB/PqqE/SkfB family radical SAM enzyme